MLAQLRLNLVLLYGAEMLGKVLGLAVFGYLGRTLTESRYGDLEFALGILFILNLVIDAGLGHYGAREAARRPLETDLIVGRVTLVRGALVLVSLVLLIAIAAATGHDPLARGLIMLQGLVLLPTPWVLTWVFQARDQMHVVAAASVIRQLLLTAGVLLFVAGPSDVWQVPVWDAIGLAAAVGLQVVLFLRAGGQFRPPGVLAGVRRVVIESAPLAASSVVWAVRLFAPLIALGIYASSAEVGVFAVGHRLVIAAHTFVWLYFFNLLPSLSRLGTEPGLDRFQELFTTSMRLVGWIALCGAALGSILSPLLTRLIFGADLAAGGSAPFSIMVWVLAAAFVSGHHRFGMIALSRQQEEFWASLAGAAVSVVGCVVLGLTSTLTPIAAAWVFVAAEGTTLAAAVLLLKRGEPRLMVLVGLQRPVTFTVLGIVGVLIWSPTSTLVAAVALGSFYAAAIAALERVGLRRLVAIRAES